MYICNIDMLGLDFSVNLNDGYQKQNFLYEGFEIKIEYFILIYWNIYEGWLICCQFLQ